MQTRSITVAAALAAAGPALAGGGWLAFNAGFEMARDPCPWDSNGDDVVDVTDQLGVLGAWGACPE
ncbi:MAG: hypothetical protein ACYTG1_01415 [Planctomycetota bacterium]|jgi:hypothetical protein